MRTFTLQFIELFSQETYFIINTKGDNTMNIIKQLVQKSETLFKELQNERDQIKLQAHLLAMDTKEEWNELEQKYEQFKTKTSTLAEVTEDSAGEVAEAIKLVGEELREGYKPIRNSL